MSRKRDARFTLQIAALRNRFVALQRFATLHPPYRAFPPYIDLCRGPHSPRLFLYPHWSAELERMSPNRPSAEAPARRMSPASSRVRAPAPISAPKPIQESAAASVMAACAAR